MLTHSLWIRYTEGLGSFTLIATISNIKSPTPSSPLVASLPSCLMPLYDLHRSNLYCHFGGKDQEPHQFSWIEVQLLQIVPCGEKWTYLSNGFSHICLIHLEVSTTPKHVDLWINRFWWVQGEGRLSTTFGVQGEKHGSLTIKFGIKSW